MPTKRIRRGPRQRGIIAIAIEAWRCGDRSALHQALGLRPWEPSPLEVMGEPPAPDGTAWRASWPRVAELRRQLIALAGPPGWVRHGVDCGP
jgi:hypothetical protein